MTQQDSPLTLDQKKAIVDLKQYFERSKGDEQEQKLPAATKVAHAFKLGIATVKRVLADYNRNPNFTPASTERGKPHKVVHEQNQAIVRQYIRQANLQGQHITVELIYQHLVETQGEQNYSLRSLGRALDCWGFCFGKGIRSSNLKEKEYVISARRRYLREKIANRNGHIKTHRPEVYLDESYVNKNHSNDFIWYLDEDGASVQKPTGKGERLIIVNAIMREGWVPEAKLVFKSAKKNR